MLSATYAAAQRYYETIFFCSSSLSTLIKFMEEYPNGKSIESSHRKRTLQYGKIIEKAAADGDTFGERKII